MAYFLSVSLLASMELGCTEWAPLHTLYGNPYILLWNCCLVSMGLLPLSSGLSALSGLQCLLPRRAAACCLWHPQPVLEDPLPAPCAFRDMQDRGVRPLPRCSCSHRSFSLVTLFQGMLPQGKGTEAPGGPRPLVGEARPCLWLLPLPALCCQAPEPTRGWLGAIRPTAAQGALGLAP